MEPAPPFTVYRSLFTDGWHGQAAQACPCCHACPFFAAYWSLL